eukprot:TRINITY_DN4119_c0_g1_i2.p1 TRINITY_DN4119_c0_g1~~TRINITY_DN4119_c0_g1_i2.p1  ORF type:complete len:283 (-),score=55.32 TRINITY_DN4119_c0_g1_i2:301-1086(-)
MTSCRSAVRLLSLDATGTLFRPYPSVFHHYVASLDRFVSSASSLHRIDEKDFVRCFFDAYRIQTKALPAFGAGTSTTSRAWWSSVVKQTFRGVLGEEALNKLPFELIFDDVYRRFSTKECWQAYPDAERLLRTVKARNPSLPVVVVSNFDERLNNILKELGLSSYVDAVITSYELGVEKPNKDIFIAALNRANIPLHLASDCLHIGDHLINDFRGPKDIQMQSKLLVREEASNRQPSDLNKDDVIQDLTQLEHAIFSEQNG